LLIKGEKIDLYLFVVLGWTSPIGLGFFIVCASFEDLPDDWRCPFCNARKNAFVLLTEITKDALSSDKPVIVDITTDPRRFV